VDEDAGGGALRGSRRLPAGLIILGLDPGSRFTGYGVVRRSGNRLQGLASGRLAVPARLSLAARLHWLTARVQELIGEHQPHEVALETTFAGVNNKSLIVMAQARGAILSALGACAIEPREFSPAEIKRTVTGNGRADKTQVARMVSMLLKIDTQGCSADATDALAVALCHAQNVTMDAIRRRAPKP